MIKYVSNKDMLLSYLKQLEDSVNDKAVLEFVLYVVMKDKEKDKDYAALAVQTEDLIGLISGLADSITEHHKDKGLSWYNQVSIAYIILYIQTTISLWMITISINDWQSVSVVMIDAIVTIPKRLCDV